ncbi:hypothetical protein H312_03106, partial [Anncaliia algerae PRA339]
VWCKFNGCSKFFYNSSELYLAGIREEGKKVMVEIDESQSFRRKYNLGRYRQAQWVFGAIERNSNKCMLFSVADRSANTLIPPINQYILPDS